MNDKVMIDKYVLVTEKSPKVIVFDNSIQRNIVSVNTLSDEHNLALAEMILAELNTGKYEAVEDDSGNDTGDITNPDNGGLYTGDNSSNDGVTPIDESEGNNGAVEPDVNNDSGNTGDITNPDNGGLYTGDNSSNDGVTPIDESEGNNGAVEPDVNNDIGSDTGNTDGDDEDLNNG